MLTQKILIAEDHTLLRDGIKSLLKSTPEFKVIAEAKDGLEAIKFTKQHSPDVILMDLSMPNMSGIDAIKIILKSDNNAKIIALTAHKSEEYVRATLESGAMGYILKEDTHKDLVTAIKSVIRGKIYLSPGICNKVVDGYLGIGTSPMRQKLETPWFVLTKRERQVTKLIAEGNKNREIAVFLSVSLKTVEKHRANLMKKLELNNASAVTKYAIENRLVSM